MSDAARWLHIKQLFRDGQRVAADERDAWLAGQCAGDEGLLRELRGLLAAQQVTHDILDAGASGILRTLRADEPAIDLSGTQIGSYRLVRLIGEGGMGSVYLAERDDGDFVQRVALKLVRTDFGGSDARARFLRERNFLARLVHPHIAQLHDGGLDAHGTPYFTLEYVEGEPITRYCDERKLDVRRRIGLVLQVCAAIAYAHRNLIVHRDLKPSNILVTAEGDVKLLDFGIAKLVDPEAAEGQTGTQARLMTPEYAAPEQVLGEPITTATDVYAIGVLLYEVLTGRLPYPRAEAGAISWSKAVVEESPEPVHRALSRTTQRGSTPTGEAAAAARGTTLSALRRDLRGDLDRIVQRALAKQPDARYASAAALADDLRAFVEGRAISGSSRRYRLRKFVRRHWLPLGAAAVIALILFGSGAAIVWQSRRIAHEAQNTLQVKDFLFGLFTAVDPHEAKGREVSAHELLDRGAERIERNKALDAEQRAEIEATLGRIYYQIGLYEQANRLQESAQRALAAAQTPGLALVRTEIERVDTVIELPDLKLAQVLVDDAHGRLHRMTDAPLSDRVGAALAQARVAIEQRDWPKTEDFANQALALLRASTDPDRTLMFRALMTSGAASWGLTKMAESEATYRQALSFALSGDDPDSPDVAKARTNLGLTLQSQSRYREASEVEAQALATNEKILGSEHQMTLNSKRDLALAYYHLGHYPKARAMMEEVIAAERRKFGDAHPTIAGAEINLGLLLTDSGDADAAERVLTESVSIFEKKYGRDYQGVRLALGDLGAAHIAQGKLDQAESELLEVLEREKKAGTPELGDFIDTYRLGDIKRLRGDYNAAIELQRAALAASQKDHGEAHRLTANAHKYLALSLRDGGDSEGAERELRAALTCYPDAEPPFLATVRYELGLLLLKRADGRDEGVRMLKDAADLREKFLGADAPLTRQAHEALASVDRSKSAGR